MVDAYYFHRRCSYFISRYNAWCMLIKFHSFFFRHIIPFVFPSSNACFEVPSGNIIHYLISKSSTLENKWKRSTDIPSKLTMPHALQINLIIHTHSSARGPPQHKLLVASNPFFPSRSEFLKVGEWHERGKKYEIRKEWETYSLISIS